MVLYRGDFGIDSVLLLWPLLLVGGLTQMNRTKQEGVPVLLLLASSAR